MFVLGVHGGVTLEDEGEAPKFPSHDSAAVLLHDGAIVAAIEEERLDRIKHSNCVPVRAIGACLDYAGIGLDDVDVIAINASRQASTLAAQAAAIEDPRAELFEDGRDFTAALFRRAFGQEVRDKLHFCHHHVAHAWSAFVPSGFDRTLILSIDGGGDNASGLVALGGDGAVTTLHEFTLNQSLGHLYMHVGKLLGYGRFDEYKVMGLAPYGDPQVYLPLLRHCCQLLPNGNYRLADLPVWFAHLAKAGLVAGARRKSAPFTKQHKDLAAALQALLEEAVLHVLRHYRQSTHEACLSLAGGVAHNCSLNGRILYSGLFDRVFVQPAAHDAGGALGAAWKASYERRPRTSPSVLTHLSYGSAAGDDESVTRAVGAWGDLVSIERAPDIAATAAELLANGAVIGWVQGRSEFGPRALGHRSILADPRPAANKLIINQMVKKREAYRPFAPSVLEEELQRFFDVPIGTSFPFMIFVVKVREEMRGLLGAVTHIDGTARVHSVSRETNPRYWELIHAFGERTGVPVLLNTSFNNNAEPIVDSVDDAVACFLTTGLDVLVVGDSLVRKRTPVVAQPAFWRLAPDLVASRRLARRKTPADTYGHEVLTLKRREFGVPSVAISPEAFAVLERADGDRSLEAIVNEVDRLAFRSESEKQRLGAELFDLWSSRVIVLQPSRVAMSAVKRASGMAAEARSEPAIRERR